MSTAPLKLAEPRRRDDEWVPALCEQFSHATGWPLRYVPASHFPGRDSIVSAESCWQAEVRDGQQLVGQFRLDLPHGPQVDQSFTTACQLSQILAGLVEQVLEATRHLNVGPPEHKKLTDLGLSVPQGPEMLCGVRQLLRAGLQLTGFRSACLFLLDPVRQELRLRAAHHLEPRNVPQPTRSLRNEPPDLHVLSSGTRIVLRRDDRQSDPWLPADAAIGFCLPVQATCGVLGTMWFYDRRPRPITSREKQLLDCLSVQVASLLERVVLQRESTIHERLRHELLSLTDAEVDSQVKSLKQATCEATWRVSSRFEIGGDLCEATALSSHEVAVVIGDAAGNSIPAAVVMTAVHGAIAALLAGNNDEARDTALVVGRINRSLFHTRRLPHFMSLVYGVLDTQTLKFTYTNAGHPSPILLRNGVVTLLESGGMLLGVIEESEYTSDTLDLLPDDVLVCYSDGISEARNTDAELFGRDGILRALGPISRDVDSAVLLNRVWNRQTAFAAPGKDDDRSLLIARVLPE